MRGFDRDLIRGGHYGQRSCEPRKKAEHMAAPTKPANVKKALANSEPSTHGTTRLSSLARTLACQESPTAEQNTERERDPRLANGAFGRAPPAEDIWSLRAASRVQTSP